MYVKAKGVMVVAKDYHTFEKSGNTVYRVTMTNGEGGIVRAAMREEGAWQVIVPLNVRYDATLDISTNGYDNYIDVVQMVECK